jgi:hypothetical protein
MDERSSNISNAAYFGGKHWHMKVLLLSIGLLFGGQTLQAQPTDLPGYKPENLALYKTVVALDSTFFHAYNTCGMATMADMFDEDIEFYHDRGGLSTSKKDLLQALQNNICNKVTRILIPGTIEVYEIPGYGAIEMGWHKFFNKQEPNAPQHASKFVQIWKNTNGKWTLARVVSLH